jgi:hypothetical protein
MKFTKAEPNEVFDALRFISQEGRWEFGCRRMLYGIAVGLSRIGDYSYTLDYCSGDDPSFTFMLLATMAKILERYPEDIVPWKLRQDFPAFEVKPIDRDPTCWKRLQEIAFTESDRA